MAKGGKKPQSPHIHAPRQMLLHNSHFSAEVEKSLADALTQNVKSPYEFVENLDTTLDWRNSNGILESMTNPSNPSPYPVDFTTIKNEYFSLKELTKVREESLSSLPPFTTASGAVYLERVIADLIKNDIAGLMNKSQKADFLDHVKTSSSLSAIIRDVDFFVNTMLPAGKTTNTLKKAIENYKLPFAKIKSQLEAQGIDFSQINAGNLFTTWPDEQKKLFDAMTSSILITRMQDRVKEMTDLMNGVDGVFSQVLPPLSTFFKKYPFDFQQLKQKYPSEADQIEQHYAQITENTSEEETKLILQEVQKMELELYLKDLEAQNAQLAPILKKLIVEQFDFSKLSEDELTLFFSDLAKARIQELNDKDVMKVFEEYNVADFETFFLELFDFSKGELNLDGHKLKITKTADSQSFGGISSLQDMAAMTEMPISFAISGFKDAGLALENLQMLEKLFGKQVLDDNAKVELKGKDIGKLMYLYLMMKKGSILGSYRPQNIGNIFNQLDNKGEEINMLKKELNKDQKSEKDQDNPHPDDPKSPEEIRENFYKSRDEIKGEKSDAPNHGFAPGAVLYLKSKNDMESMLPPFSNATIERIRVEITGVDEASGTFKAKIFGTEAKLSETQEGLESTYDFSDFKSVFGKGNDNLDQAIKILPGREKADQVLTALSMAGIPSESFSDIQIKDGKFYFNYTDLEGKSSEQEATHFGTIDEVPDQNGSGMVKNTILYKVTPKGNGNLIVSGNLPNMEGERGKYEKEMTYSDFLLFVANKKLFPKNEESAKAEEAALQDIRSKKNRKWSWVSPSAMWASIKNVWKNLNGKIDEYYKEQESACLDWLIRDFGIYYKIGKMLPGLKSVASATRKLQDEHLSKMEGEAWKGIEEWVKIFSGMQDFSALFSDGADHPSGRRIDYAIGKGNTLKSILLSGKSVVDDDNLRPIMAAAMIANIKKGKGLYRGINNKDNMGLWVRCLLGPEHYKRYMAMKAGILAKLKTSPDDTDQLQDRLKKSEIDYIVNNIRNANAGVDFGSIDDGNAQVLKQKFSEKFAGELESAANDMFGKKSIENIYPTITHNNFYLAANDFKRFIGSGRIESALANLLKMGDLAKTTRQQNELKMAMSYVTLSGVMNRYGDKKVRKWFDSMARTIMLPTAFGAKRWKNQDYARDLLSRVQVKEGPNFLDAMGSTWTKDKQGKNYKPISKSDFSMTSDNVDYKNLLDKLWSRWGKNAESIDEYFNTLKYKSPPEGTAEEEAQKQLWAVDGDVVETNRASNPGVTGIYPIFASPRVIEENKKYDRDGFLGKDEDERNSKIDFWKNQLKALKKAEHQMPPERMLQTFLTWFKSDNFATANYPDRISRIRTAQAVKKFGTQKEVKITYKVKNEDGSESFQEANAGTYGKEDYKDIVDYLFRGYVLRSRSYNPPKEFNDVLLFFKKYFIENLDKLDDDVLSRAFGADQVSLPESKRKILIPWQDYNRQMNKNHLENFGKQGKKSQEEQWKNQSYRNSSLCVNGEMAELSKALNRNGIPIAELTGVSVDEIQNMVDATYSIAD